MAACRTRPATRQQSATTAIQRSWTKLTGPSSQTSLPGNTTLLFHRRGTSSGRARLSLQNISDCPLHYRFKKMPGVKLEISPCSTGIIGKKEDKELLITWELREPLRSTGAGPYTKFVLLLSTDGNFDSYINTIYTRLFGHFSADEWSEDCEPQVLIVNAPANTITARNGTSKSGSMTSVGIQEMKRFERQLFSQFLIYITLMMFLGYFFQMNRPSDSPDQQQFQHGLQN